MRGLITARRRSFADRPDAGLSLAAGWRTTECVLGFRARVSWRIPCASSTHHERFPFRIVDGSPRVDDRANTARVAADVSGRADPGGGRGRSADGLAPRDKPGTWGDLLGVRPYRRGDTLRRIHWPQTARHGQLVVCEVQASAVPRIQIVLDTYPGSHVGSGPDSSREWAIRIAASFAEGWIKQGAEVEMILDDVGCIIARRLGPGTGRRACSTRLARLAPAGGHRSGRIVERVPSAGGLTVGSRLSSRPTWRFADCPSTRCDGPGVGSSYSRPARSGAGARRSYTVGRSLPVVPWLWIDGRRTSRRACGGPGRRSPLDAERHQDTKVGWTTLAMAGFATTALDQAMLEPGRSRGTCSGRRAPAYSSSRRSSPARGLTRRPDFAGWSSGRPWPPSLGVRPPTSPWWRCLLCRSRGKPAGSSSRAGPRWRRSR